MKQNNIFSALLFNQPYFIEIYMESMHAKRHVYYSVVIQTHIQHTHICESCKSRSTRAPCFRRRRRRRRRVTRGALQMEKQILHTSQNCFNLL